MRKKGRAEKLIQVRPTTHGDFSDGAKFTQSVMRSAAAAPSWPLLTDVQKECFHHIVQKLQRVVCGDPNTRDHWDDVAGYAMIASKRIGK
jgi:hypothetical protein